MTEEGAKGLIRRAANGDREAAGEVARRYEAHVRAQRLPDIGTDTVPISET
jgi:hypothetical protein